MIIFVPTLVILALFKLQKYWQHYTRILIIRLSNNWFKHNRLIFITRDCFSFFLFLSLWFCNFFHLILPILFYLCLSSRRNNVMTVWLVCLIKFYSKWKFIWNSNEFIDKTFHLKTISSEMNLYEFRRFIFCKTVIRFIIEKL